VNAQLVLAVDRQPEAARTVRAQVRELCHSRIPDTLVDDVQLVVSELVTNAVTHGLGAITVLLGVTEGRVAVAVRDEGPGMPRPEDVEDGSLRGRGVALVARLAAEWGVRQEPGGGKVVWCLLTVNA
jgi:anti-sigma regulatory factor (Ser/Thr protein kinase)